MRTDPDIEEGLAQCCQNQKDSWNTWTKHLWFGIALQTICAIYSFLTLDIPYMPFLFIFIGALCVAFTVASDRARTYWVAQWDERIASWIELREQYNERNP